MGQIPQRPGHCALGSELPVDDQRGLVQGHGLRTSPWRKRQLASPLWQYATASTSFRSRQSRPLSAKWSVAQTYPLNFNGSYDGSDFSNPRTVSSLWVNRNGQWQNIFLAEEERAGELR